ncbi:deoxycytidylate deaminase [Daktulosphaira vitifoliae]|uniref:deoxycytidylate deaminase n=1 Tax=Daktulosphaira vitifoliae TaxID=58002 RepID=UPI0021AAF46C|nr:deoxycytidylate deaminase [Daktulosphaira vitifoliae]
MSKRKNDFCCPKDDIYNSENIDTFKKDLKDLVESNGDTLLANNSISISYRNNEDDSHKVINENEQPHETINEKRKDYLSWDDFFMATAFLAAKRSKDPVTQVGACIVTPEKKIVGTGYNGMPIGCNDDDFPWGKSSSSKIDNKYFYVCHAEMNAVLNKNSADVRDCTIYVALFPCNECAKIIIQSGIKEVVYLSDKYSYKLEMIAAKKMFNASGVKYRQHIPSTQKLVLDFSEINSNMTQMPGTPFKTN